MGLWQELNDGGNDDNGDDDVDADDDDGDDEEKPVKDTATAKNFGWERRKT